MSINIDIWGNNIWYLFHTIAHKLKEESFGLLKNDLIETVKSICRNLPCPDCAKDATDVLNRIDYNTINTREDFELMLFNFHNYVNRKLKKPEFKYDDLSIKYKNANIHNLLNNFNIIFSSNSNNPYMMSSSFSRQQNRPRINILLNKIILHME
tara:strand:- start:489 stop:950 length:462 start_codon:yes stop_codon:yes gene_type:complete